MSEIALDDEGIVDDEASQSSDLVGLRVRTGGLSIVAGLIHLWVTPPHATEWWGYGLFFAIVALAQLAYGSLWLGIGLDAGRLRELTAAGIVGHQALLVLYLVTRTSGIPFLGPHAGAVESVGLIDIVSRSVEVVLMVQLVVANLGIVESRSSGRVTAA
ncbi:MAG: hypothetical protein IT305_31480 [Chloroflexi bacterium]|nr:hypothetical protein [Chloroflexota bacterium]